MPKYLIQYTEEPKKVVIEAPTEAEAKRTFWNWATIDYGTLLQSVDIVPDDTRISTFTCAYCGTVSCKSEWGAGRITCPDCKKMA